MKPTPEQLDVRATFMAGKSMAVEALAGTGKTSTLRLCAYSHSGRGQYLAFNRAIVGDVKESMPERCSSRTIHSLAFGAIGKHFQHRLNSPRMKSSEIASRLGIDPVSVNVAGAKKVLPPARLAGIASRAVLNFHRSIDEWPSAAHVAPIPGIDTDKIETPNAKLVGEYLEPFMVEIWRDHCDRHGQLPYSANAYLKLWQLNDPFIPVDYVMLDEAQDANPVMAAIVMAQDHAQKVLVGDSNQAIYEWNGAINALQQFELDERRHLTQSFRFGPAIAERANAILAKLPTDLRVLGFDQIRSHVGVLETTPNAILCRTNGHAVMTMLRWTKRGKRPHLVGDADEIVRFVKAAADLKVGRFVSHPDLACFDSWFEVLEYARDDALGFELKAMVDLIEEYGIPTILEALEHQPDERDADLVVTTAHKAKGRQWSIVQIASDFTMVDDLTDEEMRLRYVAVTRAQDVLDDSVFTKVAQMTRLPSLDDPDIEDDYRECGD